MSVEGGMDVVSSWPILSELTLAKQERGGGGGSGLLPSSLFHCLSVFLSVRPRFCCERDPSLACTKRTKWEGVAAAATPTGLDLVQVFVGLKK